MSPHTGRNPDVGPPERARQELVIKVETDRCVGHAQCHSVDPDLFPLDDNGYSNLRAQPVTPEREAIIRRGVALCPERALVLEPIEGGPAWQ